MDLLLGCLDTNHHTYGVTVILSPFDDPNILDCFFGGEARTAGYGFDEPHVPMLFHSHIGLSQNTIFHNVFYL